MTVSYAVLADIEARRGDPEFSIIADLEGEGKKDNAAITAALADGCAKIDMILSARFALPLPAPAPPVLVRHNVDIALFFLATEWDRLTDIIKGRFKQACAELQAIADGDAGLGTTNPPLTLGLGPQQDSEERICTRSSTRGLF